jgi:hypothetical protein
MAYFPAATGVSPLDLPKPVQGFCKWWATNHSDMVDSAKLFAENNGGTNLNSRALAGYLRSLWSNSTSNDAIKAGAFGYWVHLRLFAKVMTAIRDALTRAFSSVSKDRLATPVGSTLKGLLEKAFSDAQDIEDIGDKSTNIFNDIKVVYATARMSDTSGYPTDLATVVLEGTTVKAKFVDLAVLSATTQSLLSQIGSVS